MSPRGEQDRPAVHVATIADDLPLMLFDAMMTATEAALLELGATRIWIDGNLPRCAVMAEFRSEAPEGIGRDGA